MIGRQHLRRCISDPGDVLNIPHLHTKIPVMPLLAEGRGGKYCY